MTALAAAACDPESNQTDLAKTESSAGPAAAPSGSGASPGASASAAVEATSPLAGTWSGDYVAQKATIELAPKVTDKAWKDDDGKKASGKGTVTLTVAPDGTLTGQSKGALGNLTLSGQIDGDFVRATIAPDEPTHPLAMTGVLVGKLEGDALKGRIRVAGPDATIVREAPIELKR